MTLAYWETVGGTLIEEFPLVKRGPQNSARYVDGLVILGEQKIRIPPDRASEFDPSLLVGKDLIAVQAKDRRLGMYLMGQALFTRDLLQRFTPRSIKSIALCRKDDDVLRPLLEGHSGLEVVVMP